MARLRVQKQNETDTDIELAVILQSGDGKHTFGSHHITLTKTATAAQIQTAILSARRDIEDKPEGGVEDMARVIVDRINAGDLP